MEDFRQFAIEGEAEVFGQLQDGVVFEALGPGRKAAILLQAREDGCVPLVRTTTSWTVASQYFSQKHSMWAERLAREMSQQLAPLNIPPFNNAMIEMYTNKYTKMGFHTDQSLDLAADSWICLYSCYNNPNTRDLRVLSVKDKATGTETQFILRHNTFVCFSVSANATHVHSITLPANGLSLEKEDTVWLGLTLRTSKTFIRFDEAGIPFFCSDNRQLRLASDTERRRFYALKGEENSKADFRNPDIDYTISPGDLKKLMDELAVKQMNALANPASSTWSSKAPEARLAPSEVWLVLHNPKESSDTDYVANSFAGTVVREAFVRVGKHAVVYLAGDINAITIETREDCRAEELPQLLVIRELSFNYDQATSARLISLGRVPIDIHGLGIFFRNFFDDDLDRFQGIQEEHKFQNLTESTKPGTALRTGLYITDVVQTPEGREFHLLRCSSNFTGPSEGLRSIDRDIFSQLNAVANQHFDSPAPLNHVLAQIYHNDTKNKASIKQHADKTKDMPGDGIMAFCTFYENKWHPQVRPGAIDAFDRHYKSTSVLTRLQFRLKSTVNPTDRIHARDTPLPKDFSITLYPNSVFLMPLSTNRKYTHEIRPSGLPSELLTTRMGYVVRCSNRKAIHREDGSTFLMGAHLNRLRPPAPMELDYLRKLYFIENTTDGFIDYDAGGPMPFSMNQGDYQQPTL